jgi:hypothetical protein
MPRRRKTPAPAKTETRAADDIDPIARQVDAMFRRPPGRSPKYPRPSQLAKIEALARVGVSRRGIAAALGVSRDWLASHAHHGIDEAIDRGVAMLEAELQIALLNRVRAGDITSIIWAQKSLLGRHEQVHMVHSDPAGHAVPAGGSTHVAVGIFLPPNGRDVPAPGREIPAQFQVAPPLPSNGREPTP